MSDAEKLLKMAFSGDGSQREVLMFREQHGTTVGETFNDFSTAEFAVDYASKFAKYNVVAHLEELPYWMNPIFAAHRARVIDDEKLKEYFDAFIPVTVDGMLESKRLALLALEKVNIPTVAVDVRSGDIEDIPPEIRWVYKDAKRYTEQFPNSVRHNDFIQEALKKGIPTDSIVATIITDTLGKNGRGFVTYGGVHMNGGCQPVSQVRGILDDALEKQGAMVTDGLVVTDEQAAHRVVELHEKAKEKIEEHFGSLKNFCIPTSDHRDFTYLKSSEILLDKKAMRKKGLKDPFPASEFDAAGDVFMDAGLDPRLIKSLGEMLKQSTIEGNPEPLPFTAPMQSPEPRQFAPLFP